MEVTAEYDNILGKKNNFHLAFTLIQIMSQLRKLNENVTSPHLIIVADAADVVSVNFSARCKFSRLNAKILVSVFNVHCTMCVIYANVSLL